MAAVTSAVIAGVGAAYSIGSAEDQKKNARHDRIKAGDQAAELERQADKKVKNDAIKSDAAKVTAGKASRQRAGAAEKQGRSGTVSGGAAAASGGGSTSLLGGGQGKTLLGV